MEFFRRAVRAWRAAHARPKPIAAAIVGTDVAVDGRVEIVEGDEPALFSRRRVVAANLRVESRSPNESTSRHAAPYIYRVEATGVVRRRFAVVDDAGDRIMVSPTALELRVQEENTSDLIPKRVRDGTPLGDFLRSNGVVPQDYMATGDYVFYETVVVPGARVRVFGRVQEAPFESPGAYRSSTVMTKTLEGLAERPSFVRSSQRST